MRLLLFITTALIGTLVLTGRAAAAECTHAHYPGHVDCELDADAAKTNPQLHLLQAPGGDETSSGENDEIFVTWFAPADAA